MIEKLPMKPSNPSSVALPKEDLSAVALAKADQPQTNLRLPAFSASSAKLLVHRPSLAGR